jgi:hypothetical protein
LVSSLLCEGSIVKLDTDRGGGPFFVLPDYREPADRLDNSDLVIGMDYSGQYEAPIWRVVLQKICFLFSSSGAYF